MCSVGSSPPPWSSAAPPAAVRVIIADTLALVASSLQAALHDDVALTVLDTATSLDGAIRLTRTLGPDVVVIDDELLGADSPTALRALGCGDLAHRVLVISRSADCSRAARILMAGAGGYVLKHQTVASLARAIVSVHHGHPVVADSMMGPLLDGLASGSMRSELNARQQAVLGLLADGASTGQIATHLGVSRNTARNQIQAVMVRLGVHSRLAAVAAGWRSGLIDTVATVSS